MTTSITKRTTKKGYAYQAVLNYGRNETTGKRERVFKTFSTKAEAQAYIAKFSNICRPNLITLKEQADEWLALKNGTIKATTYNGYSVNLKKYIIPFLGSKSVQALKKKDIQTFFNTLGTKSKLAPRTIRYIYCTLNQVFESAIDSDIISKNPCNRISLPKLNKYDHNIYSVKELKQLLAYAKGTNLETAIMIDVFTGIRRGELLSLKWKDIDFENKTIRIERNLECIDGSKTIVSPKTNSGVRVIPIPDVLLRHFREILKAEYKKTLKKKKKSDYIIHNGMGEPLNPNSFSAQFARFIKKNDLKHIRFHDLRHSHATLLLEIYGADMKTISDRLGHSKVQTTMDCYIGSTAASQRKAVNQFEADILAENSAA